MAKTAVRPKIIVQAAYTDGADMRELIVTNLLQLTVQRKGRRC